MPSLSPQLKQSSHSIPQFPKKLHKMLDDAETRGYEQIVSWSDCGQSFQVHDSDALVPILKIFFNQTKYKSFLRQLQNYGFDRVTKGSKKGTCRHKYFVRGEPSLCSKMGRITKSKSEEVLKSEKKCESYPKSRNSSISYHREASPEVCVFSENIKPLSHPYPTSSSPQESAWLDKLLEYDYTANKLDICQDSSFKPSYTTALSSLDTPPAFPTAMNIASLITCPDLSFGGKNFFDVGIEK